MTVEFQEDGTIKMIPQTDKEDKQLHDFYMKNKTAEVRKVIWFSSKPK